MPSATNTTSINLNVQPNVRARHWALIQFDLNFIPANSIVLDATLYLYERDAQSPGFQTMEIYQILEPWNANTVNWLNQPAFDANIKYAQFDPSVICMRPVKIAPLVQLWLNNRTANNGLMLQSKGSSGIIRFASTRDTDSSLWPRLFVDYIPGPTPTPTPPLPGDLNLDGKVDYSDLVLFGKAWHSLDTDTTYDPRADLNSDGVIENGDLALFKPLIKPASGFTGTLGGANASTFVCFTEPGFDVCMTSSNINIGQPIAYPLRIVPATHVYGLNVRLTYDPQIVDIQNVLPGFLMNQPIAAGLPVPTTTVVVWDRNNIQPNLTELRLAALALVPQGSFKPAAPAIFAATDNAFYFVLNGINAGFTNIQFQETILTDELMNSNALFGSGHFLGVNPTKPQPKPVRE